MRALSMKIVSRSRTKLWDSDCYEARGMHRFQEWEEGYTCCMPPWPSILKSKRAICDCPKLNIIKENII